MTEQSNVAQTAASLVETYYKPQLLQVKGQEGDKAVEVLVLPTGLTAHSVKKHQDEYRDKPERRKGIANLKDLPSFIAHTLRFADEDSALFANNDMEKPSLTCVFDYHRRTAEGDPRFGTHRAHYAFPLSDEWKAWKAKDGEPMSQADFAEFLENRISDVTAPENVSEALTALAQLLGGTFASPSKLVELSRGLNVHEGAQVKQAVNLSSGEATIQYVSQHQDDTGAPLKVPNLFLIAIPVFVAGPLYQMAVRLRYRLRSGTISWFYELYREDKVFEHAFDEACKRAAEESKLPLFIGSPES